MKMLVLKGGNHCNYKSNPVSNMGGSDENKKTYFRIINKEGNILISYETLIITARESKKNTQIKIEI